MSSPGLDFGGLNLGNFRNSAQRNLKVLEALIEARANAEQQFLTNLRTDLEAGLKLAETVSRKSRDLERSFMDEVSRALAPDTSTGRAHEGPPQPPPPPSAEEPEYTPQSHPRSSAAPPALRITVMQGTRAVAAPLHLQNGSDTSDVVSLAVNPLAIPGAGSIPLDLIRFEPDTLHIPPRSEGAAQLILRLSPSFVAGMEYWAEILIAGAHTRRIPLVLQILPDGPSSVMPEPAER
jgi:hypothetical protein